MEWHDISEHPTEIRPILVAGIGTFWSKPVYAIATPWSNSKGFDLLFIDPRLATAAEEGTYIPTHWSYIEPHADLVTACKQREDAYYANQTKNQL